MGWSQLIFDLIDMRSFSNLWFWIALAVTWSQASHWVLGIPYDMVQRARRAGGQAAQDLDDLARISIGRMLYIVGVAGPVLLALVACALTMLALLGFWYDIEFCQAVFLLLFPLSIVGLINLRTAHRIVGQAESGAALQKRLHVHRIYVQIVGMIAIFVTAFWGMLQNYDLSFAR